MQFIVTGLDGTDPEALNRRLAAREAHLALLGVNRQHHLMAAALLNEEGQMRGSVMIVDFPNREAVDAWLAVEPYVLSGVWQTVTVEPCQVPPAFLQTEASV